MKSQLPCPRQSWKLENLSYPSSVQLAEVSLSEFAEWLLCSEVELMNSSLL
jgi:hypothetical protein